MVSQNKLTSEQIAILDFWHKIEFFLPYDLQDALSKITKKKQIYQSFSAQSISTHQAEDLWLNPYKGENEVVVGFELFIGIYKKEELGEQLKEMLALGEESDNVRFIGNQLTKRNLTEEGKGLSCCAKISLDEFGRLDPYKSGNIEISTAPWAIGQIRQHGGDVSCLDFDKFDGELKSLKDLLADFLKTQIEPKVTEENPLPALNGENIVELAQIVTDWMHFQSEQTSLPEFYLYPRKGTVKQEKNTNNETVPFYVEVEQIQISIMNSFFATDIAKVIRAGKSQESVGTTLDAYLRKSYKRIDLYNTDEGKECIIEHLKPQYINRGHWFSENPHHMSLMQQFAINTIFKEVDKEHQSQSLFSVNGPPGTGKTTLLRDIFAENIVRRATVMACYDNVKSTFKEEKIKVEFGKATLELAVLQDDLTGYEMVVTSSNNAAVQNISEELPQVKALGKNWQDELHQPKVTYLQNVARNLTACKKINKKKVYKEPEPQQSSWGLIACILGRKANRDFFVEQFTQAPDESADGFKENYFDSIYTWRQKYTGPNFFEAKKLFLEKKKAVETHIEQLSHYMQTVLEWKKWGERDVEQDIQSNQKLIARAISLLEGLQQDQMLIEQGKPNFFVKLFMPKKQREYVEKLRENFQAQKTQKDHKMRAEDALELAQQKKQEKIKLHQQLNVLQKQLGKVCTPTDMFENIEQDEWQISGFWSDENLNQKRAELFQAALVLHEAWISESMRFGFSGNILAIKNLIGGQQLQGDKSKVEETAKVIWQSLFMMVPVASTTFASFGFLFRYLGANSLGWVFVDEAGQAIPQAAVGALWRAKNAVVVGDPLQIEPVFTTPENLTDILLKASDINVDFEVSPHKTSVQVLSDKANPYGASIHFDNEETWIGSPLRVHRRCLEPMFSISNRIAYQGKMVFGMNKQFPDSDPWLMQQSAWLNLSEGEAQEQKEIEFVADLFHQLCKFSYKYKKKILPPVYIISPFKDICEQIRSTLASKEELWKAFETKGSEWVDKNVGTVHTFQGKENSIVLLVLGRNATDIGRAAPLVTKPNLLNVAATRAKDRFFVIGNYEVWKEKYECFKQASPILKEVIEANKFFKDFVERVQAHK